MNVSFRSHVRRRGITTLATLALFGIVTLPGAANADEWPKVRYGLWSFQHTVNEKKHEDQKCTNPIEDLKAENAVLKQAGCSASPIRKSGNTYTYSSNCEIAGRKGKTLTSNLTTVIATTSDREIRIEVRGTANKKPVSEVHVGKWIGECKS